MGQIKLQFKSLLQLLDHFKEEKTCKDYLAKQRWGLIPVCPHCGTAKAPYVTNRGYKCSDSDCYGKFSVTSGTIFENTKIPLRTWYAAIFLATAHKKGISSVQLASDLNITQKTAWFLLHRIRQMVTVRKPELLKGIVEADETYIGGKIANKHKIQRDLLTKPGNSYKTMVVGIVERSGNVATSVMPGYIADPSIVNPFIRANVASGSKLMTDGLGTYRMLAKDYEHGVVNHIQGEYARGEVHTNTIEGFFSILKRTIYGTYHWVSVKHLQRYCHEVGMRYNTRSLTNHLRFNQVIAMANGQRLTYKDLIK